MIDDKLNWFRILDLLFIDEFKNAKALLRFARNFDQQIHDLFQHIEIFLENINETSVSTIDKITIVDLINVYKHWRNERIKIKFILSIARSNLLKLITNHIDSTTKKIDIKFLDICYVDVRQKRFQFKINTNYDSIKNY